MSTPTRYLKVLQELDKDMPVNDTAKAKRGDDDAITNSSDTKEMSLSQSMSPEGPEGQQGPQQD